MRNANTPSFPGFNNLASSNRSLPIVSDRCENSCAGPMVAARPLEAAIRGRHSPAVALHLSDTWRLER